MKKWLIVQPPMLPNYDTTWSGPLFFTVSSHCQQIANTSNLAVKLKNQLSFLKKDSDTNSNSAAEIECLVCC